MNKDFYSTYYKLEGEHWWFRVRRNIIIRIINSYSRGRRGDFKILDFGCGSGYLVRELQDRGFDAFGIDNHAESIDYGTSRETKNLFVSGDGGKINFPDNTFDIVLAMDVIEHIKDDEAISRELVRIAKKGGHLIVTVPAYMWLWGVQDEIAFHFRRYRLSKVKDLFLKKSDLDFVFGSYFNTFLFPFIALVRLAEKIFKKESKRESDFDINNPFLNYIFYVVFNLETRFLHPIKYPFGVSIITIFKKR